MIPSAYVHVPFCSSICSYCAFAKSARLELVDTWLDALQSEVEAELGPLKQNHPDFRFQTLYFGGGTPSVLNLSQTKRLLELFKYFANENTEWTVEVNPESITKEKLRLYREAGVNRVSIGLQTFDEERLKQIGRTNTVPNSLKAIALLKESGIERICADLMYGFPGESLEDLNRDLDAFLNLDISHLSIYSLILEPGTRFGSRYSEDDLDEDLCALQYETIEKRLEAAGYEHYEISSYAKNQAYGKHNLLIWQDGLYYGFGLGAVGRDETGLYEHASSLKAWMENPFEKIRPENPNPEFDAIMTGLRTREGLDVQKWNAKYGMDLESRYVDVLDKWKDVFIRKDGKLSLSESGMEVLDSILVDFLLSKE